MLIISHYLSKPSRVRSGFTLPELIAILAILGILAAIAAPRFFTRNQFDAFGFSESCKGALRYAQKTAIAKRRTVCVAIAGNRLTLTQASTAGCDLDLMIPATQPLANTLTAPNGIAISAANFSFDALGKPSAAQSLTVSGGDQTITLLVTAETGYVQ